MSERQSSSKHGWPLSHLSESELRNEIERRGVPWDNPAGPNRVPPRECIAAARDALSRAYGLSEPSWHILAEALDWQRRALEQMTGLEPQ